ncbi:hypothetical protein [Sulfuriroseicoccus oceanibius]|uniref:Uncharacterized protein n=1 Tax=Sulfuriroseicoccus oceanibius TaxID=2707525 RepID=A0A6B3L800_9BACT|nr:hypothetical protein [Sulfuriroseicoccus oceanibius]QQL45374.1 hypothetical protein G3M56_001930 [Sulfuriroseicoccus oceanibius]
MLVNRSQQMSISDAVESTFSGLEPCSHCCALAAAKADAEPTSGDAPKRSRTLDLTLKTEALTASPLGLPSLSTHGATIASHRLRDDHQLVWLLDQSIDHPPRA